tara:strand:+ start:4077 stop:4964 length:888 start_codon:yes stop_codon:yes gene_type:complete
MVKQLVIVIAICMGICPTDADDSYLAARKRMQEILEGETKLPSIEWSHEDQVVAATVQANQCYMITATWCGPCRQSKKNCGELIGETGSGAPVTIVDIGSRPSYAKELGIVHAKSIPAWVVVSPDGKELTRLKGSQTYESLSAFLERNDVNPPTPVVTDSESVVATINSQPSSHAVVAAFSEHLSRTTDDHEFPATGLFDRDLSVPEQVPQILATLMAGDPIEIETAGLTVLWVGEDRQVKFEGDELTLSPPVSVRLQKWKIKVTTTLSGIRVADEGRTIRFLMNGPDFTVRFVQ